MTDPQETIYDKISELKTTYPSLVVYKTWPQIFEDFPCIVYRIENSNPKYTLNNGIGNEVTYIRIDIWSDDGLQAMALLSALEAKLLTIGYRLADYSDILEPDGGSHLTTQFIF